MDEILEYFRAFMGIQPFWQRLSDQSLAQTLFHPNFDEIYFLPFKFENLFSHLSPTFINKKGLLERQKKLFCLNFLKL